MSIIHHHRLQLHGAIYRPDSFVLILRYCANLKAIRYESTSLNRIVPDKSHHVIVAIEGIKNGLKDSVQVSMCSVHWGIFSILVSVQYMGRISRVHCGDITIHVRGYRECIVGIS